MLFASTKEVFNFLENNYSSLDTLSARYTTQVGLRNNEGEFQYPYAATIQKIQEISIYQAKRSRYSKSHGSLEGILMVQ